jgi:hypothetical protein
VITIYSVWKNKVEYEYLLLMRHREDTVLAVSLENKSPVIKEMSLLCLEIGYTIGSESVGNFLNTATKMYGTADTVRKLILSVERSDSNSLKDTIMSRKAPATKKSAAKKAPAAKKTTNKAPRIKKVAAESPAAEVTQTATASESGRGRPSKLSGMKIKVLVKTHPAREGSKRAAWLNALLSSKTVEEAQGKVDKLDAGVLRFAEAAGYISLY